MQVTHHPNTLKLAIGLRLLEEVSNSGVETSFVEPEKKRWGVRFRGRGGWEVWVLPSDARGKCVEIAVASEAEAFFVLGFLRDRHGLTA